MPIERRRLAVTARDGAQSTLQLHLPDAPRAWLYWLPALGVGLGPNETFADAMAERGFAVAVHEWRGLGSSNRRAGRDCDWGYRALLDLDVPAGLAALREALPHLPGWIGGHSLGGQFALLEAARQAAAQRGASPHAEPPNGAPPQGQSPHGQPLQGVMLAASGQPHWQQFPGARKFGVYAFAAAIPLVTRLVGHFPGTRLGFAGREAGRLMREWARTCRRGDYRTGDFASALDEALAAYAGRVIAIRMTRDALAPPGAIERLRALAPRAAWDVRDFGAERFATRRPDHFGWLREPGALADAFAAFATP